MSKVSIKDVAAEAGVSVSSVSFYMNRPERLSQSSIERIRAACEKLAYAPGKNRRGPKLGRRSRFKTRNICFYCMNPMSMEELLRYPIMPRFLGSMQEELHKHNCRLVISGTGDNCQVPVTLNKKNCDGIILFGKAMNQDFYKNFKNKVVDLPVIWSGAVSNDDANEFDHVVYNNKKVAELAVDYAVKKNYRRVAVFNSHSDHLEYQQRIKYFEEAAEKCGLEVYKFEVPPEEQHRQSFATLTKMLADIYENADVPQIDIGYFCSDLMLLKFNVEMNNRNKAVDFEMFGCNGDFYTLNYMKSCPGTIDIGIPELAKQTVKRLLQRIDNYRKPMATTEIQVEPKLVLPQE